MPNLKPIRPDRNPNDKLLFTPGPLTTSTRVKNKLSSDFGSREPDFMQTVSSIRRDLLAVAGVTKGVFESVIVQGSGTMGVESVVSSTVPDSGKLLVLANGAYGQRIAAIARVYGLKLVVHEYDETQHPSSERLVEALQSDSAITHVAMVHSETTTGLVNPVEKLAHAAKTARAGAPACVIVDAMSSFGGIAIDLQNIDFLISSSNKCVQGIPGFSFVIARHDQLQRCIARSLSLDLKAQWKGLEETGQFRFTPPTHSLVAFKEALDELQEETLAKRVQRYRANHHTLVEGMSKQGFNAYLPREHQGPIITTFLYPQIAGWTFQYFYERLYQLGFVIYPGKLTKAEAFRIGTIGHIFPEDVDALLRAVYVTMQKFK